MRLSKIETTILICIYGIILINVLLSGVMLDLVGLVMGIAIYLFSMKTKKIKSIFFVSAIGFLLLSIVLYCINSQYLPYNSAANWAYLFFFFGVLRMLFDPNLKKTSN